jgi:MFS family permease
MDSATLARAMRNSMADGALATVMGALTSGIFLTGFALTLDASRIQIGILAAIPALANIAQLLGSYWIERSGMRKRVCVVASLLSRFGWFTVVALPFLLSGMHGRDIIWIVVAVLAATSALSSIAGVAWLSWTKDLIPETIRCRFLSRRNQVNTILSLALSVVGGVFIDWWSSQTGGSVGSFAVVIAFAGLAGLGSIAFMRAVPEPANPHHQPPHAFRRLLALPLKERNFRRVVGFYAIWNLSVHIATPFFGVYMLQKLGLPFWCVTLLATLSSLMGIAANGFWTRLSEKFGYKPVVFLATLGDALVPLCWVLLGDQWLWMLIPIHLSGVFNAPLALGPNNMVLKLAPHRNASPYMAVFNAVVGPMTALATIMGGVLAQSLAGFQYDAGLVDLNGLKVVFLISFVARCSSLLLLRHVVEPQADSVKHVVRVLRRARVFQPATLPARILKHPAANRRLAAQRLFIQSQVPAVQHDLAA